MKKTRLLLAAAVLAWCPVSAAAVSWRLRPGVLLSLVGQNLLNAHHPEWARDSGPTVEIRRGAYVKLTWTP